MAGIGTELYMMARRAEGNYVRPFVNGVADTCSAGMKLGSDVMNAWGDATDLDRAVEKNGSRANIQQNDAASRGDYTGNGGSTQAEVYYRSNSDSYEESRRNMELAKKRHKTGWK